MAFYYEAEQPKWRYKQRYKNYQNFKKRDAKALEKLYQDMKKGELTVTMNWRNPDNNQDITLNVKTMSGSGSNYYHSQFELDRIGFPYPDPDGRNTPDGPLNQMFDSVKDDEDSNCFSESGIFDFIRELNIDMEAPNGMMQLFMFHAMCEADDMAEIHRAKFVQVFKKCGCSTYNQIKKQITLIEDNMYRFGDAKAKKVNKAFARWLFKFSATEAKAKSVLFYAQPEEQVQAATTQEVAEEEDEEDEGPETPLVQMVFQAWIIDHPKAAKTFPMGQLMFEFLSQRPQNSVSRDALVNIAEFLMTMQDPDVSEEELFNWPLIIGEFCEWTRTRQ